MNITRAYTLGFCCGLGFSYHKLHKLSFDASTNNPYWITTKKGKHFLIDEDGVIQSGRFKNINIDKLHNASREKKVKGKDQLTYSRIFNTYKYEDRLPDSVKSYFDKIYLTKPTEKHLIARNKIKSELATFEAITQQTTFSNFKINSNGLTKLPVIPQNICNELGIRQNKKVVLTYPSMSRILNSHPEVDKNLLQKELSLGFLGAVKRNIRQSSEDSKGRLQFSFMIQKKKVEIAFDLKETEEYYEIMHCLIKRA
jgi:hypothetical protein